MVQPRRAWWKRKRWIAAAVLWLLLVYPLSIGPAMYAAFHGWLPFNVYWFAYAPVRLMLRTSVSAAIGFNDYISWWQDLALPELNPRSTFVPDPTVNRTHWTPPESDGINRSTYTPPQSRHSP